jgi:hypothetical protein
MKHMLLLCRESPARPIDSRQKSIAVINQGGCKYLLDGHRHRMKLSERREKVSNLRDRWERHPGVQMVHVAGERYGKDAEIEAIEDI